MLTIKKMEQGAKFTQICAKDITTTFVWKTELMLDGVLMSLTHFTPKFQRNDLK